jgi:HEPN domain-containing protein
MPHDLDAETWMTQARRDLHAAEHLLRGDVPAHATVFAHLAVEKAMKGAFRRRTGKHPLVTHDLRHPARERMADARLLVDWLRQGPQNGE